MTSFHGLPARTPPPSARGTGRWFASEWSLAILALVLAVLIWAVFWWKISITDEVEVAVEPRASPEFVAFPDSMVRFALEGPRAEVEEARAKLGSRVFVDVPDLKPGEDSGDMPLTTPSQFSFPFPRRLVKGLLADSRIRRFRWEEKQVAFPLPQVLGLPDGLLCEVTLEPRTAQLRVPASTVQDVVTPDPINVKELLAELPDDLAVRPLTQPLSFNGWRKDPEYEKYRADVELPQVSATLRFHLEKGRALRNRVEFAHPEGYVVTPDSAEETIDQGYYVGTFQGIGEDLELLAAESDAWWYLVRIPPDKLPTEAGVDATEYLEIEFVHSHKLDGLRVRFEPASATVVIRRK